MKSKLLLYNTLTRKKEEFKSIKKGQVGMYSCGPTVYNAPHIGNYRAYIVADILKRILIFNKYKVKHVMNITDVDDKTIKGSREKNISLREFTEPYTKAFFRDLKTLNILPADVYPRATEHINEMVELVKKLLKKGYAYDTEDAVYYDISKFKNYGELSHFKLKELKERARVKNDEYKKQAKDFALWKKYDIKDGNVFWETELGKGRPGWHIECSAMSMKYLGEHFDIHTGGIDLIFPHHENEIAQSEAATGKKFVNFWVHNEWLIAEGKKMSKSLGNFYTIQDILDKGYDEKVIRYLLIATHYRRKLNFTFKSLDATRNTVERLKNIILGIKDDGKLNDEYLKQFKAAINDDLNIPKALAILWKFVRDNKAQGKLKTIKKMDEVFGLKLLKKEKIQVPKEIMELVKKREQIRSKKDWKLADKIRDDIRKKGYIIEDSDKKPKIKKI